VKNWRGFCLSALANETSWSPSVSGSVLLEYTSKVSWDLKWTVLNQQMAVFVDLKAEIMWDAKLSLVKVDVSAKNILIAEVMNYCLL